MNDGTDKIAAEFGAKVFREPWKGYVAQKNSAAEKCHEAWLLNLDADEVVSPQLQWKSLPQPQQPFPLPPMIFPLHVLLRALDPPRRLVSRPGAALVAARVGALDR